MRHPVSTLGALDFAAIGRGFASPALASQQVFRAALEVLSRPGRIAQVQSDAEHPPALHPAAAALALALLDQDTRLWRSPALGAEPVGAYLRFHTGCELVSDPQRAHFALVAAGELPPLDDFSCGSDDYPDRSATLIIQVDSLAEGRSWRLSGPGIQASARLAAPGLDEDFLAFWARNGALYPRGVDVFLASPDRICGLPRTVRIEG